MLPDDAPNTLLLGVMALDTGADAELCAVLGGKSVAEVPPPNTEAVGAVTAEDPLGAAPKMGLKFGLVSAAALVVEPETLNKGLKPDVG